MSHSLKVTTIGQGINLVFLHGWGVNSGVWAPLIEQLQNKVCVTTIDLPGYGLNQGCIPSPYTLETVAEMITPHVPDNSILVGWSLGGLIAQQMVCANPQHFKQLILISASPKFSKDENWPGIEPKILSFFAEQLSTNAAKTLDRFIAIQSMGSASARQDSKTIKQALQQYPSPNEVALKAGLEILASADLRQKIKNMNIPIQVFLGEADTLVPAALTPVLADNFPHLKVQVVKNTSHAPFISNPSLFADGLLKSLI
jgi:pimeloyl-[acyl-carrier protein] methyl ester esterase